MPLFRHGIAGIVPGAAQACQEKRARLRVPSTESAAGGYIFWIDLNVLVGHFVSVDFDFSLARVIFLGLSKPIDHGH